ncbi:MAG: helicase-exonuclease AddAB subunit AddA [Wujia sp.]
MPWTKEQQTIIDSRDSSILVSAAAGSGKTAVLVERIMSKLTDPFKPCNIDEFLVVTFTKAAASQMKDKLAGKIEAILNEQPENEHLMKQLVLINRASISTIDSFCLNIVKQNFAMLGIDSGFGIADNGMHELIKTEAMDELFEELYGMPEASEEYKTFELLLELFCRDAKDDSLRQIITSIYEKAMSYPRPKVWLQNAIAGLACNNVEQAEDIVWVTPFMELLRCKLGELADVAQEAVELCYTPGAGTDVLADSILKDIETLADVSSANSYRELSQAMSLVTWARAASIKKDTCDEEIKAQVTKLRNEYKNRFKKLKILGVGEEELIEQMHFIAGYMIPMLKLTDEFMDRLERLKDKRALYSFSDIEHMAYRLLCAGYDDRGNVIPTELGLATSKQYKEIYIDEYQDSNYLQEEILCSISGIPEGNYNMFMVGDVKQSIYRFRMARPELFLGKYDSFSETGNEIKIELRNNFRSRAEVLNPVNFFFYQLMGRDVGGIEYTDRVALVPTKDFPEPEGDIGERISKATEIILIDANDETDDESEIMNQSLDTQDKDIQDKEKNEKEKPKLGNETKPELEAHAIAGRIRELVDAERGMYVFDEEEDSYRPARYSDIVILVRSVKSVGETLQEILSSYNIPVYLEEDKGYFEATEIMLIMSLLAVVDNSRQDIPMSAVLLSPMADITENELALICSYSLTDKLKSKYLYDRCQCYILDHNDEISTKLEKIISIIQELKELKNKLSIEELINIALNKTGFYAYAEAMPMGHRRKANIDMLLNKAREFENGYYKGLFNFLRYIDNLKTNNKDFGEASIASSEENVVRIMTMHASKGLEYPIVFVSALGKQINMMDSGGDVLLHNDYYVATDLLHNDGRYSSPSVIKGAFKMFLDHESMGEELRILYVALTRAKEKLILTGCLGNADDRLEKLNRLGKHDGYLLPFGVRAGTKTYIELILAAMVRYDKLKDEMCAGEIELKRYSGNDVLGEAVCVKLESGMKLQDIECLALNDSNCTYYDLYRESFDYIYPFESFTKLRNKLSISEIKRMKAFDGEEYDVNEMELNLNEVVQVPAEAKDALDTRQISGSERGTLVHKFMELIDFVEYSEASDGYGYIKAFLDKLCGEHIYDSVEASAINIKRINLMLGSNLGRRMAAADKCGNLYKEQQFSIGIPVSEIFADEAEKNGMADKGEVVKDKGQSSDDLVIVQGIMDAFFYEGDEIVLVDYKTDRATEEQLVERYRAQLDYYGKTLERLTGKKVKEKIIYSFLLGKEIIVA